jgi:hypothetical protein
MLWAVIIPADRFGFRFSDRAHTLHATRPGFRGSRHRKCLRQARLAADVHRTLWRVSQKPRAVLPIHHRVPRRCAGDDRLCLRNQITRRGRGPAHLRVQLRENVGNRGDGFDGGFAGEPGHDGEPGLALMQHQEGPVSFADDQIGLPMTRLGSLIRGLRSLKNMDLIVILSFDLCTRRPRLALRRAR